jgi:hypothetical protein
MANGDFYGNLRDWPLLKLAIDAQGIALNDFTHTDSLQVLCAALIDAEKWRRSCDTDKRNE